MGFKVFLIVTSITISALFSAQDTFAGSSDADVAAAELGKKVDIFSN